MESRCGAGRAIDRPALRSACSRGNARARAEFRRDCAPVGREGAGCGYWKLRGSCRAGATGGASIIRGNCHRRRGRSAGAMSRAFQFCRACGRAVSGCAQAGTAGSIGSGADHTPGRETGEGALRNRKAPMDRIAASRFLRSARNPAHRINGACRSFTRSESAARTSHQRSRGFLDPAVSAGPARAFAPLSQTQVAG